jgi:hypothetical protein
MLTVRFPNGQAVQYNTACFVQGGGGTDYLRLYTHDPKKGGQWVASIQGSAGVIVEAITACRVYDGMERIEGQQIKDIKSSLATIKRKLPAVKKHHK